MNCIEGAMLFKSRILQCIASLQSDKPLINELWKILPVRKTQRILTGTPDA